MTTPPLPPPRHPQLRAVPGLGGLHVMPLTPAARAIVLQLAGRGLLAPPGAGGGPQQSV
jgi:hypothetical protein